MARVMREVVVCDVCGGEADVSSVTVAVDGTEQGSELCAAHRGRLREAVARVLGAGSSAAVARPRRGGRKAAAGAASPGRRVAKRSAGGKSATSVSGRMPRSACPRCGLEMGVQNLSRHIAAKHPGAA